MPASEAAETEYETTFPQDSSYSEHEVTPAADHRSSEAELHGTGSYDEEHEPTASDEDSDSDDTNTSRHRSRFRTERDTTDTALSLPTPVNKAEKRDIPDTLGKISHMMCASHIYLSLSYLFSAAFKFHLNQCVCVICLGNHPICDINHKPCSRLPLPVLSARPAVTFPAIGHHRP